MLRLCRWGYVILFKKRPQPLFLGLRAADVFLETE